MQKKWIAMAVMAAMTPVFAEQQPLVRYQSVIERQMFGKLPADFDPNKMPSEVAKSGSKGDAELTKEQEQLKSSIRFSSINITPSGETAVGFTDNSNSKSPSHYYLRVGEKRGAWELKEADAEALTMTIAKGDITVTLKLGGDSSKDATATTKTESSVSVKSNKMQPNGPIAALRGGKKSWKKELTEKLDAAQAALKKRNEEEELRRIADKANQDQMKETFENMKAAFVQMQADKEKAEADAKAAQAAKAEASVQAEKDAGSDEESSSEKEEPQS